MSESNQNKIWELSASKVHDEANPAEKMELEELLKHPENRKIYDDVNNLNRKIPEAKPLSNSSATRSWQKITRYFNNKIAKLYLNIAKYAAIVILAFGVGTLFHINWKTVPEVNPVFTEVFVPLGQMSELTLGDGTHVWLNSGTTLRYNSDFGKDIRKVELSGEAFFKVTKDKIPFRVQIKNSEVEVLGTIFAAEAYPDEDFSRITLVEGSVQLNDYRGRILKQIYPNQQVMVPDNPRKTIKTSEISTTFYQSWINGEIKFDNERLEDVVRRMERWYNVEIRFTSDDIRNMRFTGTVLKNKPVDQSIKAIITLLNLKIDSKNLLDTKDILIISKN